MSRFFAYAQFVRLPNVFTAFADIALGALAVWGTAGEVFGPYFWLSFFALLISSGCLYSAGMVWNDVLDIDTDQRERPFRPLPSGRIALRAARRLGILLLGFGMVAAATSGVRADGWDWTAVSIAGPLVVAILLYDGWLKRTWAGPFGMSTCRFLNVLLGLSLRSTLPIQGSHPTDGMAVYTAGIVGVYILGVTWFARTEAAVSARILLLGAATVMVAAIAMASMLPAWLPDDLGSPMFPYLMLILAVYLGLPVVGAIIHPTPAKVQTAVKAAIFGLVIVDAGIATAYAGVHGLLILLLLPPAMLLGRWIYST